MIYFVYKTPVTKVRDTKSVFILIYIYYQPIKR